MEEQLKEIFKSSSGIGLKNVNDRLRLLYGENCKLKIESSPNAGTCVSFLIPKEMKV